MNEEIKSLLEKYEGNVFEICKEFLEKDRMVDQLAEKLGEEKKENRELLKELEEEIPKLGGKHETKLASKRKV